ncbi:MAG: D-alanyl-D-alanine carboxypeptidase [Bacteroidia bacterium]|nr:D-alanyl-D-alanine carboxypeptidase [Bacteroidia bacterium]
MKLVRSGLIPWSIILITASLIGSCASVRPAKLRKFINNELQIPLHDHHFTGTYIIDAESGQVMYSKNAAKYFTPASNTKIATLYSALKLIPEKVPALRAASFGDTLIFSGTGDPSALHPVFQDSTLFNYLSEFRNLIWYSGNYQDEHFGPGWAWEDFPFGFSTERSVLPLYGNIAQFELQDSLMVTPAIFNDSILPERGKPGRLEDRNLFSLPANFSDTIHIPFTQTTKVTAAILASLLDRHVIVRPEAYPGEMQLIPGYSRDSLCIKMMVDSDNFLAEQLMILSSQMVSDTLSFSTAKDSVLHLLADLPNAPRWVDGSGLSRYNLFTPKWIVGLLHKLYEENSEDQLFRYFPAGGVSGTIDSWYGAEDGPFVFAKTGTLGNNYNLSGYLRTKKNRVFIFSIMNNHFRQPTDSIKSSIERTLTWIGTHY